MSPAGPAMPPPALRAEPMGAARPDPACQSLVAGHPPNTGLCPRQSAVGSRLHLSRGVAAFLPSHACAQKHAWKSGWPFRRPIWPQSGAPVRGGVCT